MAWFAGGSITQLHHDWIHLCRQRDTVRRWLRGTNHGAAAREDPWMTSFTTPPSSLWPPFENMQFPMLLVALWRHKELLYLWHLQGMWYFSAAWGPLSFNILCTDGIISPFPGTIQIYIILDFRFGCWMFSLPLVMCWIISEQSLLSDLICKTAWFEF